MSVLAFNPFVLGLPEWVGLGVGAAIDRGFRMKGSGLNAVLDYYDLWYPTRVPNVSPNVGFTSYYYSSNLGDFASIPDCGESRSQT